MPEITPRFESDTLYDHVEVSLSIGRMYPEHIRVHFNDRITGGIANLQHGNVNPKIHQLAAKINAGEATLSYNTPAGTFADSEIPSWLSNFVNERDPFHWLNLLTPPAPPAPPALTTVEQRRKEVTEWAKANTGINLFIRATMNPSQASSPTELDNRRWFAGQIWWAFVVHTLAAAQHDEWLEDTNVWPAIKHNIKINGYYFLDHVAVNEWNEAAAYMDSFSRIYQAGRYLTTAPVNIQLVPPQTPVRPTLANGAAKAKEIIYGG